MADGANLFYLATSSEHPMLFTHGMPPTFPLNPTHLNPKRSRARACSIVSAQARAGVALARARPCVVIALLLPVCSRARVPVRTGKLFRSRGEKRLCFRVSQSDAVTVPFVAE